MNSGHHYRVVFVCRGSRHDGLGHIMRSRTVAKAMSALASVHILALGDDSVPALLQYSGLPYELLENEDQLLDSIAIIQPHIVVFDTMHIRDEVFDHAKRQSLVASLSPIFTHLEHVDLLFNRTSYGGEGWEDWSNPPLKYMGLEYAVVRETCAKIPRSFYEDNLRHELLSVAVSMGGSDAGNRTLRVLESLRQVKARLLVWVLLGEGYAHEYEPLVNCVRRDRRHEIILVKATDSMWRIMRACSVAILAGGTVTYEAAYAGLPSINLFDLPEHYFLVRELVERGCCISAGCPFGEAVENVSAAISRLERDRGELEKMYLACQGVIDGKASERIAAEIIAHAGQFAGRVEKS